MSIGLETYGLCSDFHHPFVFENPTKMGGLASKLAWVRPKVPSELGRCPSPETEKKPWKFSYSIFDDTFCSCDNSNFGHCIFWSTLTPRNPNRLFSVKLLYVVSAASSYMWMSNQLAEVKNKTWRARHLPSWCCLWCPLWWWCMAAAAAAGENAACRYLLLTLSGPMPAEWWDPGPSPPPPPPPPGRPPWPPPPPCSPTTPPPEDDFRFVLMSILSYSIPLLIHIWREIYKN